jgi:glyoxylase-like metal-dependent hydrolase (beta-lactamase superfamily II)
VTERINVGVNCFLLHADEGFVLIDTGFRGRRKTVLAALDAAGCRPGGLRLVALTHGDTDHAGNAAFLQDEYGAPIAMHAADAQIARTGDMGHGRSESPDWQSPVFGAMVRIVGFFERVRGIEEGFDTFEPDVLLDDGESLAEYGLDATVLHLPGHSAGSIGVLTADGELFCGDLLANMARPAKHFMIDDMDAGQRSIDRLSSLGIDTVYPGHGRPFRWEELRT